MPAPQAWDCPICLRHVPAKVDECYCGYRHSEPSPPSPAAPASRASRALAVAGAALFVTGGAVAYLLEAPTPPAAAAPATVPPRLARPLPAPSGPGPAVVTTLPEAWKALGIDGTPLPAPAAEASASPTPSPSPTPDESLDAQRALGVAAFEAALSTLTAQAEDFRQKRSRYHDQCTREDQQVTGCEPARASLQDIARRIAADVEAADEEARRSWVGAGQRRSLRERSGLDDNAVRELLLSVSAPGRR